MQHLLRGIPLVLIVWCCGLEAPETWGREIAETPTISGRALDGYSDMPVDGVKVACTGAGGFKLEIMSDAGGRFSCRVGQAGSYNIEATKEGYLEGRSGRLWPGAGGVPVTVVDSPLDGVVVRLWPTATITGTVKDDLGIPVPRIRVRAFRHALVGTNRRFVPAAQGQTDDRGVYRLTVVPGSYIVSVSTLYVSARTESLPTLPPLAGMSEGAILFTRLPAAAQGVQVNDRTVFGLNNSPRPRATQDGLVITPAVFFPGSLLNPAPAVLPVGPADRTLTVDLALRESKGVSVSGRLHWPRRETVPPISLRLIPATGDDPNLSVSIALPDDDGSFVFHGVPPGAYVVRGQAFRSEVVPGPTMTMQPNVWVLGMVPVGSSDISGLPLVASDGVKARGVFVIDDKDSRLTNVAVVRITLEPESGLRLSPGLSTARVLNDGTFELPPVPQGRYYIRMSGVPAGWSVRSVAVNGQDVTDRPFEFPQGGDGFRVTMGRRPAASLSGSVLTSQEARDAGIVVLVFPANRTQWTDYGRESRRLQAVAVRRDGSFAVPDLPPGTYRIVPVSARGFDIEWTEPGNIQQLNVAARDVEVPAGGATVQLEFRAR